MYILLFIIFIFFVTFNIIVKIARYYKICKLGFHDKERVDSSFFDGEKIQAIAADGQSKVCLKSSLEDAPGIQYINRPTADILYIKNDECEGFVEIPESERYDYVCLKCGKHFHNVNKIKDKILFKKYEIVYKKEEKEKRKKEAEKIYRDNIIKK